MLRNFKGCYSPLKTENLTPNMFACETLGMFWRTCNAWDIVEHVNMKKSRAGTGQWSVSCLQPAASHSDHQLVHPPGRTCRTCAALAHFKRPWARVLFRIRAELISISLTTFPFVIHMYNSGIVHIRPMCEQELGPHGVATLLALHFVV